MGDHDNPSTCLSSHYHDNRIFDAFLHYGGCLRDQKLPESVEHPRRGAAREEFFNSLPPHKQNRIRREEQRIFKLRELFNNKAEDTGDFAADFSQGLSNWRRDFRARDPNARIATRNDPFEYIVQSGDTMESIMGRYSPGEIASLNPGIVSVEIGQAIKVPQGATNVPKVENGFGVDASMIFFRDSKPYTDTQSCPHEVFPNQKISIQNLIYDKNKDRNPLMRDCGNNEFRYFHIPGNNMEWVEVPKLPFIRFTRGDLTGEQEAIARNFNEERPDYDGLYRKHPVPSKTAMLLRPQFWRGQQHGGRHDAVHARHMRHRCDIIPTGK